MKKFNVGDKVKVVKGNYGNEDTGKVGVISAVRTSGMPYEVKFDHAMAFTHRGDNHKEDLYRYYMEYNLAPVESTKYKPGDEVTVCSDLFCGKFYGMTNGTNYMKPTDQMLTKRGKKVKIKSVTKTGKYMIEGSIFPWVDEMFVDDAKVEPKEEIKSDKHPTTKFKVGDKIKAIDNYYLFTSTGHGWTGVVTEVLTRPGINNFKAKTLSCNDEWYDPNFNWILHDSHFELVEESKPVAETTSDSHTFKVGQRIKMIRDFSAAKVGMTGVIIKRFNDPDFPTWNYGVRFDKQFIGGHSCQSKCEYGYGQWVSEDSIELLDEKKNDNWKVVITPDGDKTTLEHYKDGKVEKTVTVKRFSEDEYSANAAIKATVDKLMLTDKIAVTVKFDTGKGEYTYLTDDPSIEVDDRVVVPVGTDNHHTLALVTAVTPFLKAKITVPFRDLKYVIEKSHPNFKVGDVVVAKKDAPYVITTNGWTGKVTRLVGMDKIHVENNTDRSGFCVDAKHFDLLKESPKETESKKYNGKVVCVSKQSDTAYTVGKVYEFIDGKVKLDNGCYMPTLPVATLEEWNENDSYYGKFIPFVE